MSPSDNSVSSPGRNRFPTKKVSLRWLFLKLARLLDESTVCPFIPYLGPVDVNLFLPRLGAKLGIVEEAEAALIPPGSVKPAAASKQSREQNTNLLGFLVRLQQIWCLLC